MKILVGLGNPGQKYQNNRHNVGFQFVDYLIENLQIPSSKSQVPNKFQISNLKLYKTDCFMNLSGIFVKKISIIYHLSSKGLIIVHDDLDIPLGKFHIQFGVGPQLHNGLESIENHLKTKDFYRIRIGIDARLPDKKIPGETYALQNFLPDEKKLLKMEVFPKILSQFKLNFKML